MPTFAHNVLNSVHDVHFLAQFALFSTSRTLFSTRGEQRWPIGHEDGLFRRQIGHEDGLFRRQIGHGGRTKFSTSAYTL